MSKTALTHFKVYLEEKGAELAKFPELIPFFALPYVKHPKEHASFNHLFTQKWVSNIRENLIHQLKAFGTLGSSSDLEILLHSSKNDINLPFEKTHEEEVSKMREALRQRNKEVEELKANYKKLEGESKITMKAIHQKWASFVRWGN
jgi:hypothetical protein